MEQAVENLNQRKRGALVLEPLNDEAASAKRACVESSSASPHLALLEELYDLEGEDEGAAMEAPLESSTQEDLVAEMMKSLEKVIREAEDTKGGEASTSNLSPSPCASPAASRALDFTWSNEEITDFAPSPAQNTSFHGELGYEEEFKEEDFKEEDFKEDAQIRQLLQASDDELGLPLSASSSDLEESSFHEEWASLANESSVPVNFNWLDAQFEEAPIFTKEIFGPLLLF